MNVAILGASANPDRFSHAAMHKLLAGGHHPLLVNPNEKEIDGLPVYARLSALPVIPHTITMYLSPGNSANLAGEIIRSKAKRVIFNPGSENPALAAQLSANGIETVEACTLVMLAAGTF